MTHPEENLSEEWPKKVRTTFRPEEELEVDRAEYIDLNRQGLLVNDKESGEDSTPTVESTKPATKPVAKSEGK